jgi:hypothetical protein
MVPASSRLLVVDIDGSILVNAAQANCLEADRFRAAELPGSGLTCAADRGQNLAGARRGSGISEARP